MDIPSLRINPAGSDVSDLNSLEGDDNNNDTEESSIPVTQESSIKKHHSEPLPPKSNRPVIQRSKTH
jgi:hypothetical protein